MRHIIPVVLLLSACATDPMRPTEVPAPDPESAEVRADLDQTFHLRPNQVAISQDSTVLITFREIDSDSRCPRDVVCVWAGNAAARIGTATAGGTWSWHILHSTLEPRQVTVGSHTIELVAVEPARRQDVPIAPGDYHVVLRITRP